MSTAHIQLIRGAEVKHTSGPWIPIDQGEANTTALLEANGKWLAKIQWNGEKHGEEQKANMLLIAAAPDLLKNLEALCGLAKMRGGHLDEYRSAVNQALAAIDSAGGQI